jgi:hypothetical protein
MTANGYMSANTGNPAASTRGFLGDELAKKHIDLILTGAIRMIVLLCRGN